MNRPTEEYSVPALPPIELRCRNDHTFTTTAKGNQSIDCPACKRAGLGRVAVRVPTARGRRPADESSDDAVSGLRERWQDEKPYSAADMFVIEDDSKTCPDCEHVLGWEPARTVLVCDDCETVDLDPAVMERYESQRETSTEVAVRQDAGDAIAKRVELAAAKASMIATCAEKIDGFNVTDLPQYVANVAVVQRAKFEQLQREIKAADNESELAQIFAIVQRVSSESEIDRQRIETARNALQARQPMTIDLDPADYEYEDDEEDADLTPAVRQPAVRQPAVRQPAVRQPAVRQPAVDYSPDIVTTADTIIDMGAMLVQHYRTARQNKLARLEQYGACPFGHRRTTPVEIQLQAAQPHPYYPDRHIPHAFTVYCCRKHVDAAANEIDRAGYPLYTPTEIR